MRGASRIARDSVKALAKAKPSPLFSRERMGLIEVGNFEDDLPRLREADWVIEVVREDMKIKKAVLQSVVPHLGPDSVLSTNTSGLSLEEMAGVLPEDVKRRFLGTHFFNPPRYMKLLELIPTRQTAPELIEWVSEFANRRLGKGVVPAKDTPNFIANRIGVHSMMVVLGRMQSLGLTVEEVDAVTGPPLGRPKTATFRLADLVGLDTLLFVARTVHDAAPDDESRETFVAPDFFVKMVEAWPARPQERRGLLQEGGKRDPRSGSGQARVPGADQARVPRAGRAARDRRSRRTGPHPARGERAAPPSWPGSSWLRPCPTRPMRLGEIADDAGTIDRAIELGFNWELGPFRLWDALGFRVTTERLRKDGHVLPAWIDALYESGATSIYESRGGRDPQPDRAGPGPPSPWFATRAVTSFAELHRAEERGSRQRDRRASSISATACWESSSTPR